MFQKYQLRSYKVKSMCFFKSNIEQQRNLGNTNRNKGEAIKGGTRIPNERTKLSTHDDSTTTKDTSKFQ